MGSVDVNAHPWLEKPRPLRDANLEETGERNLYNLWVRVMELTS